MNLSLSPNIKKAFTLALLISLVLISTYYIAYMGSAYGIALPMVIIASAIGMYTLINYRFGFYMAIVLGFTIFFMGRLMGDALLFSFVVDAQINAAFAGLIIHKVIRREPFLKNTRHTITYAYLIYTLYLLLQIFNPEMDSIAGWFLVIRKFLQFVMIFFIAANGFDSIKRIRFYLLFWTICAFAAGAYGCYQEWFGLFDFEMNWIWSVPGRAGLYSLDNGNFRKFGTLSGPAAYGILMAASGLLMCILAIRNKAWYKRVLLLSAAAFVLLGMAYSGTRTAYFIFAAGCVLYILMTITNKSTLIVACLFLMGFVVLLWGPIYGNSTINRKRSTFEFSDDASMAVRDVNRAFIQPYIYSHPIGGGLATSGLQGGLYNPNHYLAGFPPDSGFLKTVIETGWIGFFFQCLLYCLILLAGVRVFYRTQDETIKTYSLTAVIVVFSFIVSQYGQVSIGQFPDCFLFYSLLAIIVRLSKLKNNQSIN